MNQRLMKKLYNFLVTHHPDLVGALKSEKIAESYLQGQIDSLKYLPENLLALAMPENIIEELCLEALTSSLKPSRYNFILSVLQEEFNFCYMGWKKTGILAYEVLNLLQECALLFERFGFNDETADDIYLRIAISKRIRRHAKQFLGVIGVDTSLEATNYN